MDAWVDRELGDVGFPDRRLKARLGKLLGDLGRRIGGTLPAACQDWAATGMAGARRSARIGRSHYGGPSDAAAPLAVHGALADDRCGVGRLGHRTRAIPETPAAYSLSHKGNIKGSNGVEVVWKRTTTPATSPTSSGP
jgi:Transposase DNA-binding